MAGLLDGMTNSDAAARQSALTTRAEILAREANPERGDEENLRQARQTLNRTKPDGAADLTHADDAADARVIRQVLEHERAIAQSEVAESAGRRTERVKLSAARLDAAQRELRAAEEEHNVAWGDIQQRSRSASVFRSEASRLREQHPRAFGQEPPALVKPQGTRFGVMQQA